MKAGELRLGNLCLYADVEGVVDHLEDDRIGFSGLERKHCNGLYENNLIEPIPLIEEWLLKFGFEKKDNTLYNEASLLASRYSIASALSIWYELKSNGFIFKIYIRDKYFYYSRHYLGYGEYECDSFPLEIKHVHSLQNLFYALTNTELILKP